MFSIELMRESYNALFERLGGDRAYGFVRQHDLFACYQSPRRKYHTLEHIYWVLRRIDEMADDAKGRGAKFDEHEWDVLRWAAWYHDAVLEGSPDDEELSANKARWSFPGNAPGREEAARLILATAHDRVPLDHWAARLCDADLSILGADPEHFDRYEAQVREEWAHVPTELFNVARATILKRFADRHRIYMTDYGRTRWERKARQNLARSMAKLIGDKTDD